MSKNKIKEHIKRIKRYADDEREARKIYRELGNIVVFAIWAFVILGYSAILAFSNETERVDSRLYFMYFVMYGFAFSMLCQSSRNVAEKGQLQNIFEKYLFVPRKMKNIFLAKAVVIIRDLGIFVLVSELLTLLINLAYNGGRVYICWDIFAPLIVGIVMIFIELLHLYAAYSRCLRRI